MTPTRSFYAASVSEFLDEDIDLILGRMSLRLADIHNQAERSQLLAWQSEIEILKASFRELGEISQDWSVLLEAPILRLGRRMDAVVLMPGVVAVVEFKIGAGSFTSQDIQQVCYYAVCLRDFHAVSQVRTIVPILCAENAKKDVLNFAVEDGVANVLKTNRQGLREALKLAAENPGEVDAPLSIEEFDYSDYRPTPNIIEAARALYGGHTVADIGRGDAAAADLQASSGTLEVLVHSARRDRKKIICFVTGTPGAGKTLLGLNLALRSRVAGSTLPPASLLSGNPPLVHVLVEALAEDAHKQRGVTKPKARHEAASAIQGLLGFLRQHSDGGSPPEKVIVFDEAQRAWDAEVGLKLLGRKRSEPALFLDIMGKSDWAALICLVGPGQEINRGEGGMSLWGQALEQAAAAGEDWEVWSAPGVINPLDGNAWTKVPINAEPRLHLSSAMRAYRNPKQSEWVAHFLEGDIDRAADLARQMSEPPAYVSRDLSQVKTWLERKRDAGRTVGLLQSSGAVRLVAEGVPVPPRSNELDAIARWFLRGVEDYRSSGALETPLSEFCCQGLELDYVGLCWDGDLLWNDGWVPRTMSAPRWRFIKSESKRQFRINGYRVLLTRARLGNIIYVPRGSVTDITRTPSDYDRVAELLIEAGCVHV